MPPIRALAPRLAALALLLAAAPAAAQEKRPLTALDLYHIRTAASVSL